MRSKVLEMRGVDKSFPGVRALSGVSFDLYSGEVHVLLGENGAGKSTLMKVLTCVYPKDSGEIILDGEPFEPKNPKEAADLGIGIIYQEFNLLPDLTVSDNIFIGREFKNALGIVNEKEMYRHTKELLDRLNLTIDPNEKVARLSVGHQQMIEIAKAISTNSKVLIMDEPTAALSKTEIEELFEVIVDLKQKGVGIIYISHRLEEIEVIADRVTVLRDGKCIDTLDASKTTLPELIKLMVGRSLEGKFPKRNARIGKTIFSVKHLNQERVLHDINFDVREGEVFGIAGIVGAGRTELARAVFGADVIDSGEISLDGHPLNITSPRDAIQAGIAYLTEDRKKDGLMLDQTLEDNIMIANANLYSKLGVCDFNVSEELCMRYVKSLGIKTPSIFRVARNLSGGNQQKVILAKWLCQQKRVFIMDEPTRGIDVGAKREVYHLINNFAEEGAAVIVISSELPEILGICDRVMVMCRGKVTKIFNENEADQEKIIYYATKET